MADAVRPLKILQVASGLSGWGGIENHLIHLARELKARGHDVSIACRLRCFVEAEAKKYDLPVVSLICRKKHDWAAASSFAQVYQRERYDVVHTHGGADHVVPPSVARWCGVPAVLMTRHTPKRLNAISRLLYGTLCYDELIAVSDYVRAVLLRSGIGENRVTTIYNTTDPALFDPDAARCSAQTLRAAWHLGPDARMVVGFAGRFVPEKGGDVFLRALAQVPEVTGVLFGDGPLQEEWKALAASQGIDPARLIWAGFHEEMVGALGAVDALVLPSVWEEPCATVVLQAMALEKPVIGTATGGTPELIAEGETGLIVPPGDVDALAQAINDLSRRTPEERARMGQQGRERVRERFSIGVMAERVEAVYDRLVSAKRRA